MHIPFQMILLGEPERALFDFLKGNMFRKGRSV